MSRPRFDLSVRRLHPAWLLLGAVIGRAVGLIGGLNFAFWYFASPGPVLGWQILGAVAGALFFSFLMTSRVTLHTKGALLGLGLGFGVALYWGEIWALLQADRDVRGLACMTVAEGIIFDWLVSHASLAGLVIGWIIGAAVSRRRRRAGPPDEPVQHGV